MTSPHAGSAPAPESPESTEALRRSALWTVPALLVLTVVLGAVLAGWQGAPDWAALGLGAAGWLVALLLRGPVAAVAARLPEERAAVLLAAASGPCEEIVRVLLVVFLVSGFPGALWAGFGWAAIEIGYTIVNALVIRSLLGRDDAQAREVRRVLQAQGMLRADGVIWSVVERIAATLLHIGFTLLVAWRPWLVVATVPVHSAANLLAARLAPRSLPLTEAFLVIAGAAVGALGLIPWL